jgi:hypothetical protein
MIRDEDKPSSGMPGPMEYLIAQAHPTEPQAAGLEFVVQECIGDFAPW